jgi:hypothetical protein
LLVEMKARLAGHSGGEKHHGWAKQQHGEAPEKLATGELWDVSCA